MTRIFSVPFEASHDLMKLQQQLGISRYLDFMWQEREPSRPYSIGKWPFKRLEHQENVTPFRKGK